MVPYFSTRITASYYQQVSYICNIKLQCEYENQTEIHKLHINLAMTQSVHHYYLSFLNMLIFFDTA